MEIFQRGETVIVWATIKEAQSGSAVTPTGDTLVDIYNPVGSAVVSGGTMAFTTIGSAYFDYNTSDATSLGVWKARVKASEGTRVSIGRVSFEIEK